MNHHLGNLGIYSQSSSKSKNVKYGLAGYKSVLVTSWGGHHFPGLATMILTHNWDVKWSSKGWWMGWLRLYIYILVGGLEHGFYVFHIYWEFHHPNWRTHISQRGRYTTNQYVHVLIFGFTTFYHITIDYYIDYPSSRSNGNSLPFVARCLWEPAKQCFEQSFRARWLRFCFALA